MSGSVCFFSGCSYTVTVDVLTESNLILVETPILHFSGLEFSSRFERINKPNRDYSCWQILNLEYPPKIPS